MSRKWYISIAAVVAILIVVASVLRIVDSEIDNRARKAAEQTEESFSGIVAEYRGESVCEVLVELGEVISSSTVSKNIRIINNSTTPLVLIDYSTLCRCMWLEYSREPIAVGESRDMELVFDSRGEWGTVGNYIEITTSVDGAPIVLWIDAEIM